MRSGSAICTIHSCRTGITLWSGRPLNRSGVIPHRAIPGVAVAGGGNDVKVTLGIAHGRQVCDGSNGTEQGNARAVLPVHSGGALRSGGAGWACGSGVSLWACCTICAICTVGSVCTCWALWAFRTTDWSGAVPHGAIPGVAVAVGGNDVKVTLGIAHGRQVCDGSNGTEQGNTRAVLPVHSGGALWSGGACWTCVSLWPGWAVGTISSGWSLRACGACRACFTLRPRYATRNFDGIAIADGQHAGSAVKRKGLGHASATSYLEGDGVAVGQGQGLRRGVVNQVLEFVGGVAAAAAGTAFFGVEGVGNG